MTLLFLVGAIALVLGLSVLSHAFSRKPNGVVRRVLRSYEALLSRQTEFLFLQWSGSEIARAQWVTVIVLGVLLCATAHPLFVPLIGVALFGPFLTIRARARRRVAILESQLDTWLLMLSNALKSTASAADAVASTVPLVPRPFSDEVGIIVKELRLGVSFDRAVRAAARRIASPSVSGAFMLILVARRSGADLSGTLARASGTLRESARLEGVLRTKTAEGRGQVLVLAVVPFLLCFLIASLDASWFEPMLFRAKGQALVAACAMLWCVAVAWAHRIVETAL